jgi:Prp8 binding protein
MLWRVYGECENIDVLKGHEQAVLDLAWSPQGDQVYTASADKTGAVWDVEVGKRTKRLRDHTSYVNSICSGRGGTPVVITGSDDCTTMLWDLRSRGAKVVLESEFQVLGVALSDDGNQVFSAGIDNEIKVWDVRNSSVLYSLSGHSDSVTAVRLSPDGCSLLSTSMDNTVRIWDIRPFVSNHTRLINLYEGATHDFQKNLLKCSWSPDGNRISCGSADRFVNIWDVHSRRLLYKLPGHSGSVNEVDFHPTEPIIVSCSDDKKIFLGEVQF